MKVDVKDIRDHVVQGQYQGEHPFPPKIRIFILVPYFAQLNFSFSSFIFSNQFAFVVVERKKEREREKKREREGERER